MLSRIGGGNSGIVYYLETGQKQGRELGRDDLDYRLCLDGNIEQLDHVINSIPDKGQERYLHISLSFHENQVNEETLKAVCEEYKTLLMNAYDKDEYCFYAEAHIPKVKNVVDEKTGLLIERKPHIHIVIPEKNLLTGNKLNPTGMVDHYVKNLDAIQEHINNKFNLASPKDGVRVSDQNHANVLSRMKGDLFSEAKSEFKQALISDIESKNIKSEKDFLTHLSQFGEVKTYNQGKSNQYYGVKLPNETKFTRLKSPLFSKQFIETRTIPLIKPTPKQIEKALHEWCSKTSHEIKHIHPAGEKLRKTYAKLNDNDKAEMLLTLRNQYNERYNIEREPRENIHGQLQRGRNSQRSFTSHTQRTQSRSAPQRLSSLQERNMVYELRGYGQRTTQQSNPILPSNERGAIKNEQSGQYHRGGMRRAPDSRGGGRITNPIQQTLAKLESKPSDNDLMLMREIRKTIEPERFLSYCVSKYNIDPELHKITFAKDNSPRFKVGKLNLNASDFLTKHLGLSWEDAKIDLLSVNEAQQKNEPFLSVLSRVPLNAIQSKERTLSRENAKKQLNAFYRDERKMLETNYKLELKQLYGIKDHRKREVERGFIMFNHLKQIDALNKITQTKRSTVNAIHNHWKPNDLHQQVLLKNVLTEKGNYMTNKIMNSDTDFSFEKSVARKRQFNDFEDQVKNGQKLTDLVAHKKDKEVEYLNQKTKEVVFKDTGTHLEAKSVISKNEAAMMLEYAEKKYGGSLRLSGSEAFKETIALAAAEKGMKIILEPEKYHEMMLNHAEKMKQSTAKPEQNSITHESGQGRTTEQHKQAQLDIIKATNPMKDDIHTGVRSVVDIKTFKEAMDDFSGTPDFTKEMAEKSLKNETITIYSSKPIEQGTFVTPSKIEAESYAGGGTVYSKEVNIKDVAWIDSVEGQYAKVPEMKAIMDSDKADSKMIHQEQTSNQENKPIYFVFEGRTGLVHTDTDKNEAERIFNKWSEQANTSNNYKPHEKDVVMYEKQLNQQELEKLANINKQSPLNLSLSTLKKEFKVTQADEVKSNLSTKANEFIDKPSNQNAIIDGKDFNKLIVVPVHKDDGFEKSVVFKVAFKHDDKMVTQLKDVTESDLNRMGINTKNIDMRKVEPISIDITKLANANVESPLKHAEKQLNAHVEHMKSKPWTRSEFDELKEQRGKLEANVEKAKEQHTPEQTQQNDQKKTQEQSKGQSL
ncbi:LPD7 domain-containing protein [Providencia stuartii]|uniref:LPD7 domain-containing protein n=1 Tax=Providencia stuartii TaxID=588 RepID=UPI0034DD7207